MVDNVLKRITKAEAEAASILNDAEKAVRKIEERNYADIEKMRNDSILATTKEIKALEQEAVGNPEVGATVSLAAPTETRVKSAKKFIIDLIIGGKL